ncbi:hypothetical protein [Streptomyces anthocyanicus]|uniref:hypothetical protein n=1 Tax=Streptomyces anthocyanicus TaxID=68174 RepID=UPI0037F950F2
MPADSSELAPAREAERRRTSATAPVAGPAPRRLSQPPAELPHGEVTVTVTGRRHTMQRPSNYSPLQWEVATRLVTGTPLSQLAGTAKGTAVHQAVQAIQARLGVLTLRATVFRLYQDVLPVPGPYAALDLDPVTRMVWEALRWDILDADLVPGLAAHLRLPDGMCLSSDTVTGALDRLTEMFRTTRHGLIRFGFAHGVLTPGQSTLPPVLGTPAAAPPGAGAWDPSPAHRRALALRASGRDVASCARADATTPHAITGRLSHCRKLAGVRTQRALIHRALCDEVLLRPAVRGPADGAARSREEQLVWQHLPLDVPDAALPAAICALTGLNLTTVHGCLRGLRIRYRDDCAAIYAGWAHAVLDNSVHAAPAGTAHTDSPRTTGGTTRDLTGPTEGGTR